MWLQPAWAYRKSLARWECWSETAEALSATGCSAPTDARPSSWSKKERASKQSTKHSMTSAWPWDPWRPVTWRAWTSAGVFAKSTGTSRNPANDNRSPKTNCAKWAATDKRPAQAGTNMTRTGAPYLIRKLPIWYENGLLKQESNNGKSRQKKSSIDASTLSSTRALAYWRRASPCGP